MLRAATLTAVLTLTGSSVAQTVCLVLCAGMCPVASTAPKEEIPLSIRANGAPCPMAVGAAPVLTEGSRVPVTGWRALTAPAILRSLSSIGVDPAGSHVIAANAHAEPPPGIGCAPLVLRI